MKRTVVLLSLVLLSVPLFGEDPDIPKCRKTLGVTWQDVQDCMAALTREYPDQFQGAVFGYIPSGSNNPTLATVGAGFAPVLQNGMYKPRILWQGSVTKPFTHLGALMALEATGISIDTYLANVGNARDSFINGDPYMTSRNYKETITLRQVLSMSAGFGESSFDGLNAHPWKTLTEPAFFDQPGFGTGAAAACFQAATGKTNHNYWRTGEPGLYNECVFAPSVIGDPNSPYVWKPGRNEPIFRMASYLMRYPLAYGPIADNPSGPDRYKKVYSNVSSIIASWLTEGRTGQTFNNHAKASIFTPLGMTDTFYNPINFPSLPLSKLNEGTTQLQRDRIAHMINKANGVRDTNGTPLGLVPCNGSYWCDIRDWPFLWPEGGLYSTPQDLMTFMRHVRDGTLPVSTSVYNLATMDQLQPNQAENDSRTAIFAYARNGIGGFVDQLGEGTVLHGGYPGAYLVYDKPRQLVWYFGTQRVMRHHSEQPTKAYFQAGRETFAEARLYSTMLTSMLENVKPENLNFFFDASRARKRNQYVLRYASRPIDANGNPVGAHQDAYKGCKNESDDCDYVVQRDYAACDPADGINDNHWFDLSAAQRTMTVFPGNTPCPWAGTGSLTDNRLDNQQTGPFRLELKNGTTASTFSSLYPNSYTIALWVRPHSTAAASIIARVGSTPSRTTYQVGIQNGRFIHTSWDASGTKKTVVGDPVTANRWYNVVARATKFGTMTLFINGRQVGGSVPIGDFVSLSGSEYRIGSAVDGLGTFTGDVGAVGVYTQELSPADILRNCNGLKYRYPGMTCG